MKAIGNPFNLLFGALGALTKPFGSAKPTAQPVPLPTPTRDDARAEADMQDALYRRRGGAADMVTGAGGAATPNATGKVSLGS